MTNFKEYLKLAKNKIAEKLSLIMFVPILANFIIVSHFALAFTENAVNTGGKKIFSYKLIQNESIDSLIRILNPGVMFGNKVDFKDSQLPQNNGLAPKYAKNMVLTAYNSEVGQTDDSPCLTANGFNVCKNGKEDTVAVNGMKFGTRVRFPELFGERVFVVRDRMNSRYDSGRADVWMISKADAKKFGVKVAKMEVLE